MFTSMHQWLIGRNNTISLFIWLSIENMLDLSFHVIYNTIIINNSETLIGGHQVYGDDTQIYLGISIQYAAALIKQLKLCLKDGTNSKLKLNQRIKCSPLSSISILELETLAAVSARNIGVIFHSELEIWSLLFDNYVNRATIISEIGQIRRHLTMDTVKGDISPLIGHE